MKRNFKHGATLIETMIVITICGVLFFWVYALVAANGSGNVNPWLFPDQAKVQQQQRIADELAEQNRLLREQQNKDK